MQQQYIAETAVPLFNQFSQQNNKYQITTNSNGDLIFMLAPAEEIKQVHPHQQLLLQSQLQLPLDQQYQKQPEQGVQLNWKHVSLMVAIGYEASVLTPVVQAAPFELIVSIVLAILVGGGWFFYGFKLGTFTQNAIVKVLYPLGMAAMSLFTLFYIFSYVLELACPDDDPDHCAGEASVVLVIFIMSFVVIVNVVYCLYRLIYRD